MNRIKRKTIAGRMSLACASLLLLFLLVPGSVYGQQEDTLRLRLSYGDPVWGGYPLYDLVYVECRENCEHLNRFDLLIDLGSAADAFDSASKGNLIEEAEWEYFSYEVLYDSLVHIEVIRDVPEVPGEPFQVDWDFGLARLWFQFPADSSLDCAFLPLKFYWFQCDDNIIETINADTIFVSEQVYDFPGVHEGYVPFPYPAGVPGYRGTPDWCLDYISDDAQVMREIEFYDGGFQMYCLDSLYPGALGDVNLNSIPCEIADMVLFVQYFLYGVEVFDIDQEAQIERTDVNCDGEVLTFRDLVYIRMVSALGWVPCEPLVPVDTTDVVWFTHDPAGGTVSVQTSGVGLSAVYLVFSDSVQPTIAVPQPYYEVQSHYDVDSNETYVLIPPVWPEVAIGTGPLLDIEGPGALVEATATDYWNSIVPTMVIVGTDIDFAVALIQYVFFDGPVPEPFEQADADCSGYVDIDDIVWVIEYIFMGGPAPGDC